MAPPSKRSVDHGVVQAVELVAEHAPGVDPLDLAERPAQEVEVVDDEVQRVRRRSSASRRTSRSNPVRKGDRRLVRTTPTVPSSPFRDHLP